MKVTSTQLHQIILRETKRSLREAGIAPSQVERDAINPPIAVTGSEWDMDILGDTDITEWCSLIAHRIVQHAIDAGFDDSDAEMMQGNNFYALTDKVEELWNEMKDYTGGEPSGLKGKVW